MLRPKYLIQRLTDQFFNIIPEFEINLFRRFRSLRSISSVDSRNPKIPKMRKIYIFPKAYSENFQRLTNFSSLDKIYTIEVIF